MNWEMKMTNKNPESLNSEEILESTKLKLQYFESILGKAKELTPQQQDEFESKFHNAVRMRKWIE